MYVTRSLGWVGRTHLRRRGVGRRHGVAERGQAQQHEARGLLLGLLLGARRRRHLRAQRRAPVLERGLVVRARLRTSAHTACYSYLRFKH